MSIQPYVFFNGRCEEAIAFYRSALGAEVVMLMRNRESPDPPPPGCLPPGSEDKIMHAEIRIGGSSVLVSDGMADGKPEFRGFSLSLTVASPAEAERKFNAIAEGGSVTMPLGKTFFSPAFGMATDRFGVPWMVYVAP
ncbi:MAG: VOC family protein [Burkholderiales bacterium]